MLRYHSNRGFTLIELMITIAIIGILAAVALPAYQDYATKGKLAEASSTLSDLQNRMEQYYQDNRTYGTGGACGIPAPTAPTVKYFTFSCASGNSGQSYTYTATGTGATAGFTFTVTESGAKNTTAVPSGWSGQNGNCWVTGKGGC